jgi:exosortase
MGAMSQHQINSASVSLLSGASARQNGHTKRRDANAPALWLGLSHAAWIQIGVITALFSFLFWPNLRRLWDKTNPFYGEANWGHAIGIPVIGLYYLYVNREKLLHPDPDRPASRLVVGLRLWTMAMLAILLPLPLIYEVAPKLIGLPAGLGFKLSTLPSTLLSTPMIRLEAIIASLALLLMFAAFQSPNVGLVRTADDHSAGWFGGYIMVFGILLFAFGIYPGQNDFIKDFGMVVTLFGVVTALTGWPVMRIAWFPVVFLICGIPWPGLVYAKIAGPLQQLAANVAVWTLQLTGVQAQAGGTKIMIEGFHGAPRTLNVAEACAGLRSLMTFISVAAAVAFLSSRALWQKIIIVLSAIPIAIFCNVMRVSGQGLLDHYVSQQLSENFAHQFVGLIMMIPAFLLILLVAWILDQIFLEQVDRHQIVPPKIISRSIPQPPSSVTRSDVAAPAAVLSRPTPSPAMQPDHAPLAAPTQNSKVSATTAAPPVVVIKNAPLRNDLPTKMAVPVKPAPPAAPVRPAPSPQPKTATPPIATPVKQAPAPAKPAAPLAKTASPPANPATTPAKAATPPATPATPTAAPKTAAPGARPAATVHTPPPSVRLASKPRPSNPPQPPNAAPPKPRTDKPTPPGSAPEAP